MGLYLIIFHLLIVIGLNKTVVIATEGENEPTRLHRNDEQNASRSCSEHVRCPPTNSQSAHRRQSVREIPSPKTISEDSNNKSPSEKQTIHATDEGPELAHHSEREETELDVLIVTPKTGKVDAFQVLQNMNIDSNAFGVLSTIEIRHSSALVECSSTDVADKLLKTISESEEQLDVERLNFCCHVASIEDLPQEVTRDDINYIMYAKYHELPTSIRFVPYAPYWKEDVKVALIDVNSSLLQEILESPKVPIQWIEYTIDILVEVDDCLEDTEQSSSAADRDSLNYSQLLNGMIQQMRQRPLKINHISKFSIVKQQLTEEKSVTEDDEKTRASNKDNFGPAKPSHDRTPSIPPRENIRGAEQKILPETVSESLKETLDRLLPLGEQTLMKIVDETIEKTLDSLRPLLRRSDSDSS